MNTTPSIEKVEADIRKALEAGPTPGPWKAAEFNEVLSGDFIPSFTALPVGRFHRDPAVDAIYIAACNPANITAILGELDMLRCALSIISTGVDKWSASGMAGIARAALASQEK